jgi:hypothetical protein
MDRRSAVRIHFDREDHTGRSLDLSARLDRCRDVSLRARRGHFFINRLMLVLGHSIAVEKRMLDVTHTHLFTFRFRQGTAQPIWLENS